MCVWLRCPSCVIGFVALYLCVCGGVVALDVVVALLRLMCVSPLLFMASLPFMCVYVCVYVCVCVCGGVVPVHVCVSVTFHGVVALHVCICVCV